MFAKALALKAVIFFRSDIFVFLIKNFNLIFTFFIKKFPRECCRTSFFSRRRWTWNWTSELQRFNNMRHRVGASRCQLASFFIAPFKKRSYSGLSREESLKMKLKIIKKVLTRISNAKYGKRGLWAKILNSIEW